MAFNHEGREARKLGQNMKGNVVPLVTVENPSFEGRSRIFEQQRQAGQYYKCGD